jgi:hypothetical protein
MVRDDEQGRPQLYQRTKKTSACLVVPWERARTDIPIFWDFFLEKNFLAKNAGKNAKERLGPG